MLKKQGRRKSTFWTLFFSYGSTLLIIVRNLAMVPLYLKYIDIQTYGAWLATGGVLGYLTIADFGLMGVLTQQTAVTYGSGDRDRLGKLIGTGLGISVVLSLLIGFAALGLFPFISRFMHITGKSAYDLQMCFLIVALSNSFNLIGYATGGVLKSFQLSFYPSLFYFLSDAGSIVVTYLLICHGWGLYSIALGLVFRGILSSIGSLTSCLLFCYRIIKIKLSWTWEIARQLWSLSIYQLAIRCGAILLTNTDAFLVGVLLGPKIAGFYVLTIRAPGLVKSLASGFGDAIMPSMAHLFGEGNINRFKEVTLVAIKIQTILAVSGIAGIIGFNKPFVALWIGPEMYAGTAINTMFGFYCALYIIGGVMFHALYASGEILYISKLVWMETAIRIPLTVILLYFGHLWGAPLSALIALAVPLYFYAKRLALKIGFQKEERHSFGYVLTKYIAFPVSLAIVISFWSALLHTWIQFVCGVVLFLSVIFLIYWQLDRNMIKFFLRGGRGSLEGLVVSK
jgi:O-antigen/teichoic acid export membrane protein